MTITPVSASTSGTFPATPAAAPKQTMDSSVFMTLLVTQLRNQDPSAPMDTNQMISQTTQLSMMEQLTQMSTTSTENFALQMRSAAAALLGKSVTYAPGGGGVPVTGVATAVSYAGSVPQVTVGGVDVALDSISGVADPATATPATTAAPTAAPTTAPAPATPIA